MTTPKAPKKTQRDHRQAVGKPLMPAGLSPTVEKMFGALVDRPGESKENAPSEPELKRPSAA